MSRTPKSSDIAKNPPASESLRQKLESILKNRTAVRIALAVIGFIILNAVAGIIGNNAYALYIWLWNTILKAPFQELSQSITSHLRLWIIFLLIFLASGGGNLILWNLFKTYSKALNTSNDMVELDDSLLRLLASIDYTQDLKTQMRKVLEESLRDAIKAFPKDIYRASILLPNAAKEYLYIRVNYKMPEESIQRAAFYIGDDKNKNKERGVAGIAYRDRQLYVGHIRWKGKQWYCDDDNFVTHEDNDLRPSYNSFVCVPIIGLDPSAREGLAATCLGVICFDSHSLTAFDSPQTQKLLMMLGRRIAAALTIHTQHQIPFTQEDQA